MKYLFDSSAIFRAIKENNVEILVDNYTLGLARYELGNIIWKDCVLQAKISEQEAKGMAKTIKHILGIMKIIETVGYEEEVLEDAMKYKITFYDAAYAHLAKAKDLKLITEDARLIKKITSAISVSTLEGL
jgi:predicted nucleic acid-binding protein